MNNHKQFWMWYYYTAVIGLVSVYAWIGIHSEPKIKEWAL